MIEVSIEPPRLAKDQDFQEGWEDTEPVLTLDSEAQVTPFNTYIDKWDCVPPQ